MTRLEGDHPRGFARNWHTSIVCNDHGVTLKELQAADKRWHMVLARRELWFRLIIVETGCSLPMGARYLKKDHTTALYSLRRFCAEHYGTGPKATLAEMRAAYQASLEEIRAAASNERIAA